MPKKTDKKSPLEKQSRCPKGTIRNKKTGLCEAKILNTRKNKSQKAASELEKRRECIKNWRLKHLRNSSSKKN